MNGALGICVLIVYICASVTGSDLDPDSDLLVETKNGMVLGKYNDAGNARVFKSIPYGGSVSGTNRWKDPQPPADWTEVWDTTEDYPSACPQLCATKTESSWSDICAPLEMQTEDCLFLNVFTPSSAKPCSNLPVLVFFHGGAFVLGYSTHPMYEGSYLASNSDIVVVTVNYRLGALGGLVYGRGDDAVDGNFGIKDQRLALQWVQDNIASFGGNPKQVTISGESAGAMSVAIHMTTMRSTGLFHQAIIQSSPFGIYCKTAEEEKKQGNLLAMVLECNSVDCLRDKSVEEILKFPQDYLPKIPEKDMSVLARAMPWAPVIDGDQLTDQPLTLFNKGHFNRVPTIVGATDAEGIMMAYSTFPFNVTKVEYGFVLSHLFGFHNGKQVLHMYPPDSEVGADQRPQLSVATGDYTFYCPAIQLAKSIATFTSFVPVYSYIFDHPFPGEYPSVQLRSECGEKACHGAELPYLFHTYEDRYTDDEKVFAEVVLRYWGNFVNTGDPNTPPGLSTTHGQWYTEPSEAPVLPKWPQFTSANKWESFSMDVDNFQAKSEPRKEFCELLDSIGYGFDQFGGLLTAVGIVTAIAE